MSKERTAQDNSDPDKGQVESLVVLTPDDIEDMVVVRESSAYDYVLMQGMIEQTLAKCSEKVQGVEELKEIGILALMDPKKYGGYEIREGGTRAVVFQRGSTLFLYSAGSAAMRDIEGDNAFVRILRELVARYEPRTVWASSLTRLVRSPEFSGGLMQTMMDNVNQVIAEMPIDLRTPTGKVLWQVLAMVSGMERDMIIARHTAGRINQWKRKAWMLSMTLPPGYRLDEDRHVHIDKGQVPQVREMLKIMANPQITPRQACDQIGALGISNAFIRKYHGDDATYASVRSPSSALKSLTRWLPVYESGSYTVVWKNPFPGVEEVAGVRVIPSDDYKDGVLEFDYTLPLPKDGWATADVFAAASARRHVRTPGGAAHRTAPPLSGAFSWSDRTHQYAIASHTGRYLLYRRPLQRDRKFEGWEPSKREGEAEHLATVRGRDLHRSIAENVGKAVRDGVAAELLANEVFWLADKTQLPKLGSQLARTLAQERKLEETRRLLDRAHGNAKRAKGTKAADLFVQDTIHYTEILERLQAELEDIKQETPIEPTLADRFESNAAIVAAALANLATADDTTRPNGGGGRDMRSALSTILHDTRLVPEGKNVRWSLRVHIPVADGIVSLGPITGTVANIKRNKRTDGKLSPPRRRKLVQRLVGIGVSLAGARVLANCPHHRLVEALTKHLLGAPGGELDKDLVEHVGSVYTDDDFRWMPGVWRIDKPKRQQLLDLLTEAGGELTIAEIEAAGIDGKECARLSRDLDTPTGKAMVERIGPWGVGTRATERTVRLQVCPHCGGWASLVCLTPETTEGVLCPDCRRMPTPDSPVFPSWYTDN